MTMDCGLNMAMKPCEIVTRNDQHTARPRTETIGVMVDGVGDIQVKAQNFEQPGSVTFDPTRLHVHAGACQGALEISGGARR